MQAKLQFIAPFWLGLVPFLGFLGFGVVGMTMRLREVWLWGALWQPIASLAEGLGVWWVILGIALSVSISMGFLMERLKDSPAALSESSRKTCPSNPLVYVLDEWRTGLANDGTFFWDSDTLSIIAVLVPLQVPWMLVGPYVLQATNLWQVGVSAALAAFISFWVPATRFFELDNRIYLRKQNPLVALIRDASSQRWIRHQIEGVTS
jgi:hypothetical protein